MARFLALGLIVVGMTAVTVGFFVGVFLLVPAVVIG